MLTALLKKEILEHRMSPKFLIGILIATALMATSTIMNLANYRRRQQDYLDAQRANKCSQQTRHLWHSGREEG